jgi:hypothetical protein
LRPTDKIFWHAGVAPTFVADFQVMTQNPAQPDAPEDSTAARWRCTGFRQSLARRLEADERLVVMFEQVLKRSEVKDSLIVEQVASRVLPTRPATSR